MLFPVVCHGFEEELLETVLAKLTKLEDKTKELEATIADKTDEFEAKLVAKTEELEAKITDITRQKENLEQKLTSKDQEISKLRQHANKRYMYTILKLATSWLPRFEIEINVSESINDC